MKPSLRVIGYLKWWSIVWGIFGIVCIVGFIIFKISYPENPKVLRLFFLSIFILIKNSLYLKIYFCLKDIFLSKHISVRLRTTGICFLALFFMDLASFFFGDSTNSKRSSVKMFAEILPVDGFFTQFFLKIYGYIPAVYDFLNPQIEGISLFLIGVCLISFSREFQTET